MIVILSTFSFSCNARIESRLMCPLSTSTRLGAPAFGFTFSTIGSIAGGNNDVGGNDELIALGVDSGLHIVDCRLAGNCHEGSYA